MASKNRTPNRQLELVISLPQSTAQEGRGVDHLYTQILKQAVDDVVISDNDKEKIYPRFRTVVGAVLLVFNPLSTKAFSDLLKVSDISTTLNYLYSLLLVPEKLEDPIQTFHKSFPDFLTDPKRCKDKQFFVDPAVHHAIIFFSCMGLMKERLRKDICNLDYPVDLSEVDDLSACQKENIGDALKYACHFWPKHLLGISGNSPHTGEVQKAINEFFSTSLLYWIEVLVLTRNLGVGVYAMNDVEQWYTSVSAVWVLIKICVDKYLGRNFMQVDQ